MPRTQIKTLALPLADIPRASLVMGIVLGLFATLLQIGCARQSTVHAESREIPLTSGDGSSIRPSFSKDGKYVAYTVSGEGVHIVPAKGGEPRKISKDQARELALAWTGDDELLVWSYEAPELRWMDIAGNVIRSKKTPGKRTYFRDVSSDQKQFLWCDFSGPNSNLGITFDGMSDLEFLVDTPAGDNRGCFGPDPGEVTVVRNAMAMYGGEILIWSAANRTMTPMTIPKGTNNFPAWSPDRNFMAYTSDNSGNTELWIYDRESDRAVQLTSTPGQERFPKWSPDGEWLTFERVNVSRNIFVFDIRTQETRQLTKGDNTAVGPVASEDGEWVAYVCEIPTTETSKGRNLLCVVSVSDSKMRTLDTSGLKLQSGDYGRWLLSWSPEGTEIAFAAENRTGNVDIYRISRKGGPPQRVTLSPGADISPNWSPDGSTIAYRRGADGDSQIWAIPATGGIPKKLTSNEGVPLSFAWGADSDQLAYASATGLMSAELWVTSYRAPERSRRILETHEGSYPIAWSADNSEILVVRVGNERYPLLAVSPGTSKAVRVGELIVKDERIVPVLSKKAEKFKSSFCPGGVFVYDFPKERSNIYSLHVPDLIEAKLTASGDWN